MIRWIFAIAVALATLAAFLVPPAQNFREPELARIIFFHLPCAISTPIFFIFVFPRLPYVQQISFHPSNTIVTGGFDPIYSTVLSTLFIVILVLCAWVYKLAVRVGLLELKFQNYGELEIRGGDTASIGVVRPIPLSQEGGTQAGRG